MIIPAYNEAATISRVIGEVVEYFDTRAISFEIIVVAEGTDGTDHIARDASRQDSRVRVFSAVGRRGKGAAVREGVLASSGGIVGFIDADRKSPIGELDRILPLFGTPNVHAAIGSRAVEGAVVARPQKWYRRVGSRVFAGYLHALLGLRDFPDTQCGLKFFRREVALELFTALTIMGYVFDVELLYLCARRGYRVVQLPVRWSDDGDSRLDLVSGNIRNFADVFRLALRNRFAKTACRSASGRVDCPEHQASRRCGE